MEKHCLSRAIGATSFVSQEKIHAWNSIDFFQTATFFAYFFVWSIKKYVGLHGSSPNKRLVRWDNDSH